MKTLGKDISGVITSITCQLAVMKTNYNVNNFLSILCKYRTSI